MYQTETLFSLNIDCESAVKLVGDCLQRVGFQVISCFDLQAACASQVYCSCPHHGMQRCDCQYIVLLIYGTLGQPLTLVAHGNSSHTILCITDNAQSIEAGLLRTSVLESLNAEKLIS